MPCQVLQEIPDFNTMNWKNLKFLSLDSIHSDMRHGSSYTEIEAYDREIQRNRSSGQLNYLYYKQNNSRLEQKKTETLWLAQLIQQTN